MQVDAATLDPSVPYLFPTNKQIDNHHDRILGGCNGLTELLAVDVFTHNVSPEQTLYFESKIPFLPKKRTKALSHKIVIYAEAPVELVLKC